MTGHNQRPFLTALLLLQYDAKQPGHTQGLSFPTAYGWA